MFLSNKIVAIKAVRDGHKKATLMQLENLPGQFNIVLGSTLSEDKELVEAIMDLGVREFLDDQIAIRSKQVK